MEGLSISPDDPDWQVALPGLQSIRLHDIQRQLKKWLVIEYILHVLKMWKYDHHWFESILSLKW